jgi:Cu+-exporting ATPase
MAHQIVDTNIQCFHCGEDCGNHAIKVYEKKFCCDGCKMVYEILSKSGMCDYYDISDNPGINQRIKARPDKFAFLETESIAASLISFKNDTQTHITFYLPQIHCSSCLWLLENLHQLNEHIISSKVNFERKEADIVFNNQKISTRKLAELLTNIGYEPYISLNNLAGTKPKVEKSKIYKLGVAGFCFANIMLMSFPEYLGIDAKEANLINLFRYLNVLLALPVFFYSASEFYISAWKSLKHKFLNIDVPIVLSVVITFGRSLYEVFTGEGLGYFDSMSGIVFFMLAGRVLQDKTYAALSFERDYTAYFPLAITKIKDDKEESIALPEIKLDDTLLIHNQELIPADGILTRGKALIDYSFVTGESAPVAKEMGEIVYAGGKQIGSNIELLVIKEVTQSYLTKLWNREELNKDKKDEERSFVHLLSKYFTIILFTIATITAVYWAFTDSSKIWNAVTAVLIVACPCALLLSNTFTNGNILRRLSRNNLYLRNAQTIEDIARVSYIVFDKTGTLTTGRYNNINYEGETLSRETKKKIASLAAQSNHPMSKAIVTWAKAGAVLKVTGYSEIPGFGIEGFIGEDLISLGSKQFVCKTKDANEGSLVYVAIEGEVIGKFSFMNEYREHLPELINELKNEFQLAVLSGDNAGEKKNLQELMGFHATILFNQQPTDKLETIQYLQKKGKKVMMIGDGLNDAGALKQANVGIAITESSSNFTPASDGIMEAAQLPLLYKFIQYSKFNKKIVTTAFVVSILYNIVGISFAVQGILQPVVAAILMPSSTISILLITFGLSNVKAWQLKLK